MVGGDLGNLASERTCARADGATMGRDAVRLGDGRRLVERSAQLAQLDVEVGIQRQLLRDDERRDEDHPRAAVGGEAAGEVERMLGLAPAEERDDDRPVADGDGAAREALRPAAEGVDARPAHHRSW